MLLKLLWSTPQIVKDRINYKWANFLNCFWTPCAIHALDILFENLSKLEWTKKVRADGKVFCKFILNHHLTLSLYSLFQSMNFSPLLKLYLLLNSLPCKGRLEERSALRNAVVSDERVESFKQTDTPIIWNEFKGVWENYPNFENWLMT